MPEHKGAHGVLFISTSTCHNIWSSIGSSSIKPIKIPIVRITSSGSRSGGEHSSPGACWVKLQSCRASKWLSENVYSPVFLELMSLLNEATCWWHGSKLSGFSVQVCLEKQVLHLSEASPGWMKVLIKIWQSKNWCRFWCISSSYLPSILCFSQ